jgi:hypothetical protein
MPFNNGKQKDIPNMILGRKKIYIEQKNFDSALKDIVPQFGSDSTQI